MDKFKNSEKKQKKRVEDLMVRFLKYVRELGVCLLPEEANELDVKEVKYIIDYFNQQFAEVLDQHSEYKRLPILVITIYGDHRGYATTYVNPSTDREIATNFRLPKMVDDLKVAIDEWDLDRDKPLPETSKTSEAIRSAMIPFMALRDHIKKDKK